jgi:hypothetical protein
VQAGISEARHVRSRRSRTTHNKRRTHVRAFPGQRESKAREYEVVNQFCPWTWPKMKSASDCALFLTVLTAALCIVVDTSMAKPAAEERARDVDACELRIEGKFVDTLVLVNGEGRRLGFDSPGRSVSLPAGTMFGKSTFAAATVPIRTGTIHNRGSPLPRISPINSRSVLLSPRE